MIKVVIDRKQFESQHKQLLEALTDPNKVLRVALTNLHALISERVQQFGRNTDGSVIGGGKGYSTGTLNFKGITGKFEGIANKKQIKSRIKEFGDTEEFYGGYKEFREALGRQTNHIDYTLSGDMFRNFNIYPIQNGFGLGFSSQDEFNKMEWLTDQKGVFILPSEQEKELAAKDILTAAKNVANRNR